MALNSLSPSKYPKLPAYLGKYSLRARVEEALIKVFNKQFGDWMGRIQYEGWIESP